MENSYSNNDEEFKKLNICRDKNDSMLIIIGMKKIY